MTSEVNAYNIVRNEGENMKTITWLTVSMDIHTYIYHL